MVAPDVAPDVATGVRRLVYHALNHDPHRQSRASGPDALKPRGAPNGERRHTRNGQPQQRPEPGAELAQEERDQHDHHHHQRQRVEKHRDGVGVAAVAGRHACCDEDHVADVGDALDPLSRVEHQAVSAEKVQGVPVADIRIVQPPGMAGRIGTVGDPEGEEPQHQERDRCEDGGRVGRSSSQVHWLSPLV